MKKITLFICIIILVISCNNKSAKESSQKNDKHALIDSIEIDNFIDDFIHFERKKVKIFSEKKDGRDQGAYFYKTKKFDVLQIGQFGTIGKREVYYFILGNNISHITNIDFKYNQPYYQKEGFEMTSTKQDFFIRNSSLILYKLDGKKQTVTNDVISDFEELKKEGLAYLENLIKK